MMHHWYKAVDDGQSIQAVFIAFAKAFDHVDHNILIARLAEFGLPVVIIQWTCSFLRHRHQRVKIREVMSDWLVVLGGTTVLFHGTGTVEVTILPWYRNTTVLPYDTCQQIVISAKIFVLKTSVLTE